MSLRPDHAPSVSLSSLVDTAGGVCNGEAKLAGITASSVLVRPGDLFAALPGAHAHGARFGLDAVEAGARAFLTDPAGAALLESAGLADVPCIVTPEVRDRLGEVAASVYGWPSRKAKVLGVTGTSGKTTTTFLVRAGLEAAGIPSGLIGTVGVFLGSESIKTMFTTPEAPELQALLALMVERGISAIPMEVSSHALTLGRANGIRFEVAAFTNLSQDHLDFHKDMEDYFAAKLRLFSGIAEREIVVVDDEWGRRVRAEAAPNAVTVSTDGSDADWRADRIVVQPDGSTRFQVSGPGFAFESGCRIPGRYNVANALLAFAILAEAGVDPVRVAYTVERAQVRGRMERVDGTQPFMTVVDYSHKPAGVENALAALRPLTTGRLIIVLGCGGDRDQSKRPVMGEVAARNADILIVTDDNPRSEDPAMIRASMLLGARNVPSSVGARIIEEGDRHAAIARAIALAGPGDTVLVAGKGHETGQEVGTKVLPFDDVAVVQECLAEQGFSFTGPRVGR